MDNLLLLMLFLIIVLGLMVLADIVHHYLIR